MVENTVFHCLVEKRKQKRQKIGEKVFPLGLTFFILPNQEGKVMRNTFQTNTSILLYSPTRLTFPLLYNKDIIINLYKLHFSSSAFSPKKKRKFSTLALFHLSNQTHVRENQIFYVLPLFYPPTNFPSSHFSIPPTKQTLILNAYGLKIKLLLLMLLS